MIYDAKHVIKIWFDMIFFSEYLLGQHNIRYDCRNPIVDFLPATTNATHG